jgi:hydroxyacylglutathione hydrolase
MKRDNRRGPELMPALPAPPPLDAAGIAALENRRDVAVLDTRPRAEFLAGHLAGAILAELDYQFCAIAGSYVEEGTPIYLLVDETRLDEAVRALIRVGLDRVAGYFTPGTLAEFARAGGSLRQTETIEMGDLETRRLGGGVQVLDVRGAAEYNAGHVPGALHIPHTRLGVQLGQLPAKTPLLVYCNSGARAAAAVSLLEREGFQAIDVNDPFANYRSTDQTVATHA